MSLHVPEQFPKRCSCCRAVITRDDWRAMPFVGEQADAYERLELRNHSCGSTLAVVVAVFRLEAA